jgi:hypothetical protein
VVAKTRTNETPSFLLDSGTQKAKSPAPFPWEQSKPRFTNAEPAATPAKQAFPWESRDLTKPKPDLKPTPRPMNFFAEEDDGIESIAI